MSQDPLSAAAARRQAGDLAGAKALDRGGAVGRRAGQSGCPSCCSPSPASSRAPPKRPPRSSESALGRGRRSTSSLITASANARRHQGRLEEAAAELPSARFEIDPSFAPALGNLGATYQELGRLEEAIERLRAGAQTSGSEHPQSHFNLANALQAAGRLEPGRRRTTERTASRWRRRSRRPIAISGVVLQKLGDGAGAAACFQRAHRARSGLRRGPSQPRSSAERRRTSWTRRSPATDAGDRAHAPGGIRPTSAWPTPCSRPARAAEAPEPRSTIA